MPSVTFSLSISPEVYLTHYQGIAKNVIVECHNGQTVQFPASFLRQFIQHDGIHGHFAMHYDENCKCLGIERY